LTYEILLEIKEFIRKNYGKILLRDPVIFRKRRLRVYLDDGSFIDIRYANPQEYSLHWQGENKIIRVDTAPHHPHLASYPRHVHLFREDNIVNDDITILGDNPVENVRRFLEFVIKKRKDPRL